MPTGTKRVLHAVSTVGELSKSSLLRLLAAATLCPNAVAMVDLTESMLTTIYTVAVGLGVGATAMVTRRIGGHDRDGAARAAAQSIGLGVIVSALLGVSGVSLAPRLLAAMGASPEVIGSGYMARARPRGVFLAIAIAFSTLAVISGFIYSGGVDGRVV